MSQAFAIDLDYGAVEATVEDLEANSFFQSLVKIRELDLSEDEQTLIFEIAQRHEASLSTLQNIVDGGCPVQDLLDGMVQRGYLFRGQVKGKVVYRLSALLNPTKPITAEQAVEIQRQMSEAGQQGVLEAYIRELIGTQGEKGLEVTKRIMVEKGMQVAAQFPEVQGQGPRIVGLRFVELLKAGGNSIDVVHVSDEQVRFRVRACAYHLVQGEEAICDAVSEFDRALVRAWGCEIDYPVTIPKRGDYCEGVVRAAHKEGGEQL